MHPLTARSERIPIRCRHVSGVRGPREQFSHRAPGAGQTPLVQECLDAGHTAHLLVPSAEPVITRRASELTAIVRTAPS